MRVDSNVPNWELTAPAFARCMFQFLYRPQCSFKRNVDQSKVQETMRYGLKALQLMSRDTQNSSMEEKTNFLQPVSDLILEKWSDIYAKIKPCLQGLMQFKQ